MPAQKTYNLIKQLLQDYPSLRNSDKKLIWSVWIKQGKVSSGSITMDNFLSAKSTETIRRCRQKIQEMNPELRPDYLTQLKRESIEKSRGTYIFREQLSF